MGTIAIDGLNEETFRRSIESKLRHGKAAEAIAQLRRLLEPYAGPGRILPERFLTVTAEDLVLRGWDNLANAIARHEPPGRRITALSVAFGWPGEEVPEPDAEGRLAPLIETAYFTDEAYPFSQSAREDLLDGYSYHGCTWADQSAASDHALTLDGIDDLNGALAALEARLLATEEPDDEEICAGSLGACLLSALLIQAVSARVERDGLPRPICLLAGSNGVYPYFDAPVVGLPPELIQNEDEVPEGQGVPGPRYSSLLVTGIPRAKKRAVLVLEETSEEAALRTANLRAGVQGDSAAAMMPAEPVAPIAPPQPLEGIVPIAGGPLMAKKPGKHANWDFRDMLGPPDGERPHGPPPAPPPPAAAPEPVAGHDWADEEWDELFEAAEPPMEEPPAPEPPVWVAPPRAEPAVPPPAASEPVQAEARPAEPGFALIENDIQLRLKTLIAPPAAPIQPEEQAVDPEPAEPEAREVPAPPAAVLPEGPVWPLGIGYLEAAEQAAEAVPELPAQPRGLWARLRDWLGRR